jgi:guanosine-3',5'-bis(diphosphate) 3'-pyrophosphohydrolase
MINTTGDPRFASLLGALNFAADKHRDQRRMGATASPYINHPIDVATLLSGVGGVEDLITLQAAILHDTVEDTKTTPEEIVERFGPQVASIVAEVTDDKSLPKQDRKRLQVENGPHLSRQAQQIKLADKISNVRDIAFDPPPKWPQSQREEYVAWAMTVVDGLRGCNPPLEDHFDRIAAEARERLALAGAAG